MSLGYTIVFGASCLFRWPVVGFMVGSVSGDPVAWHDDPQVVQLCTRLTWVLLMPWAVGVLAAGAGLAARLVRRHRQATRPS